MNVGFGQIPALFFFVITGGRIVPIETFTRPLSRTNLLNQRNREAKGVVPNATRQWTEENEIPLKGCANTGNQESQDLIE